MSNLMDFEQLQKSWQHLGATDPRWAILTEPGREGGGWDDHAFWRSGEETVGWVAQELLGVSALPAFGRALDFGCGHGRLTQALGHHFREVVGVDVAESMVTGARAANRHGDRVTYLHNPHADLRGLASASFDFVITLLVLQHMRPEYSAAYLREFLRVLKPGGILFFQIPTGSMAPPDVVARPVADAAAAGSPVALRTFTRILPPHMVVSASAWMWVRVAVHNAGAQVMRSEPPGAVALGVRCESLVGSGVSGTTWAELPRPLPPGQGATLLVPVRAPANAGRYDLAALPCFDRVWCAHAESAAAISRLMVETARSVEVPTQPPPRPQDLTASPAGVGPIEMYATNIADVHATITTAGGEFVQIGLNTLAGYEWVSAHCVVRRR